MKSLRRLCSLIILITAPVALFAVRGSSGSPAKIYRAYVGTYTATPPHARGRAEGIYVYRLDPASGALTRAGTIPGVVNPSFLAPDPRRRYLYAANEAPEIDGRVLINDLEGPEPKAGEFRWARVTAASAGVRLRFGGENRYMKLLLRELQFV